MRHHPVQRRQHLNHLGHLNHLDLETVEEMAVMAVVTIDPRKHEDGTISGDRWLPYSSVMVIRSLDGESLKMPESITHQS